MGHRHLFSSSQFFEMDQDQNQNHLNADHPYVHLGRAGVVDGGSFVCPTDNMLAGGVQYSSQWNSAPRSNDYSYSSLSMEVQHYQGATSGASYDPFLHPPSAGNFCPVPQNYSHGASSSSHYRHTIHGVEGSVVNPMMGNGRGRCKRKSPAASVVCERGSSSSSSSRDYSAGSSSDLSISSDLPHEKPNSGSQHWPHDTFVLNPNYRGNGLSIAVESSERNVRSRSTLDLEVNLVRTHLSSNTSHPSHLTGQLIDHSDTLDLTGLSANATTREWNVAPAARGRIMTSDASGSSHETNQVLVGGSTANGSADIGGYYHDLVSSRNSIASQNLHGLPTQTVRGSRSSYSQRAMPAYRATSSNPRLGYMGTSSNDDVQSLSATYSSRHSRPLSTVGWRNSERNGRSRMMSYERFRSFSDMADANDRLVEGLTIVDRSTLYGSRNSLDQHRGMRLDIDNMSYEELLALGERMGSVNTGVCEDLISKCLVEKICCSSDLIPIEGNCVICLEEYEDKEEVGALKSCGHDYHVGCIKKWLSMKNACPICKTPALEGSLKEK